MGRPEDDPRPTGATVEEDAIKLDVRNGGSVSGGINREFYKAVEVIEAIEGLPKDVVWGNESLNPVGLAILKATALDNAIYSLDRPDFYGTTAVEGVIGAMGGAIDDWLDGKSGEKAGVLVENQRAAEADSKHLFETMLVKELLGIERVIITKGSVVNDDESPDGDAGEWVFNSSNEEIRDWAKRMVETNLDLEGAREKVRSRQLNESVMRANDFFNLVGCTPERAAELAENGPIVESRRRIHYWMSAQGRAVSALADYTKAVIQDKSDLGAAESLLTKNWDPKPGNTELFSILRTPIIDDGVTAVFRALTELSIVTGTEPNDVEMVDINGTKRKVRIETPVYGDDVIAKYKKYGLWDEKGNEPVTPFRKKMTPEDRRKWFDGMRDLVKDALRGKGYADAAAASRQCVALGLAYHEFLFLSSRASVRRKVDGTPLKVPKTIGKDDKERVVVDYRKAVVYETEKSGSGTWTSWFDDIEEKMYRTNDRFRKEARAGHSAPTALTIFSTPERFFASGMERAMIETGEGKMSMLEAVRRGYKTVGECFGEMVENERAGQALSLYRSIGMFKAFSEIPTAKVERTIDGTRVDPKFMDQVEEYFKGLNKAMRMVFRDEKGELEHWKMSVVQANVISQLIRFARRSTIEEGGGLVARDKLSLESVAADFFDSAFQVIEARLCVETPEMKPIAFSLGRALANSNVSLGEKATFDGDLSNVRISDRVGMLLFEDVTPEMKVELDKDLANVVADTFARMADYGPRGVAFDRETHPALRDRAVSSLWQEAVDNTPGMKKK